MKEESKKKQWKYDRIVKDLHTTKYHQRVKKPKERYEKSAKSITDGMEEHLLNEEKNK
tara:strand:- start:2879 stop:3052 length:174 start_codon:yes stop_codon:yes gene_type:complete